jgi:hypothetical protein
MRTLVDRFTAQIAEDADRARGMRDAADRMDGKARKLERKARRLARQARELRGGAGVLREGAAWCEAAVEFRPAPHPGLALLELAPRLQLDQRPAHG